MPRCLEWAEERNEECIDWRDDGSSQCDAWGAQCCTWWPCSWACELVTWVCIGWVWVSHFVCVAWNVVTTGACLAWDGVTTLVNALIVVLESTVGWILDAIAFFVELIFAIPFLGRFLKWLWNFITWVVWTIVSLPDALAGLIGIRPEKKLRICSIILSDGAGNALAPTPYVVDLLQWAVGILRQEANIRLVRLAPFEFDSGFADDEVPTASWVQVDGSALVAEVLDIPCNVAGAGADLGNTGTQLDILAARRCFFGAFRRVTGYGAPVTCFVIRSLPSARDPTCGSFGCGLWITDYVTIRNQPCATDGPTTNRRLLAHELGHAGNLWHLGAAGNPVNLMGTPWNSNDPPDQVRLEWWQVLLIRGSKHVTYF